MAALVVAVFVLVVCSSQNYPFVIWPAIIVTARGFFLPDHRQPAKPQEIKMRAARDAGDLPVSTVHVRKDGKHTDNVFRRYRFITGRPARDGLQPYSCLAPAD
jgi:hypothetical protein